MDTMPNQVCLLCLQVIDKFPQQIRLETLHKLLTRYHHNYKPFHESDLDGDQTCDFCPDCYPLFDTMEEIRKQISLLEEQVATQMKEIHKIIDDGSSSQLENGGMADKIVQIRDMIFHATAGNDEEEVANNYVTMVLHDYEDEVHVKEEYDDEIDPLGDVGDQFFDDDDRNSNSPSEPRIEKAEEEDQDEETAFCIFPQINLTIRKDNPKCYGKRKREDSPPPLPKPIIKQSTLQPDRPPTPEAPTPRASPRTKKQTPAPKRVKSLASKKICPIKASNSMSNSVKSNMDRDTKSTSNDDVDTIASTYDAVLPRPHKCTKCSKSFRGRSALTKHAARFHSIPCVATSCTDTFDSVKLRDAHLKTAHDGLAPYQCRLCKSKFSAQSCVEAHMVMRHENGEKNLSCVKCDKKFCLEENLARHLRLHDVEGSKPLVCDVCDKRFEDEERLKKHMAIITHTKHFECTKCPKRCKTKLALERHLRTHTKEKPEKCPHCDQPMSDVFALRRHIARVHPAGPAPHICDTCGKGFHCRSDFKTHLTRHDGKFGRKCEICGEQVPSQRTLESHMMKVHGKDPLVCDECGATYTSVSGFMVHKKAHTGERKERKHKCETCGACFINPGGLRGHIRTHTNERPFPCPHCDKAFKTNSEVKHHVKVIHTIGYVAPLHKCPHCDKVYHNPGVLSGHIRQIHTKERPFTCDQCGKGFAVKPNLTNHLRVIHSVVIRKRFRLPRSKKDPVQHVEEDND